MKRIEKLEWFYTILNIIICISCFVAIFGTISLCTAYPNSSFYFILLFAVFLMPIYYIVLKYSSDRLFRLYQLLNKYK